MAQRDDMEQRRRKRAALERKKQQEARRMRRKLIPAAVIFMACLGLVIFLVRDGDAPATSLPMTELLPMIP